MKRLLLIDANSLIHRCFHALPPLTNKKGEPTGALYGVSNILLKIIETKKLDFAAALFDRPEPTLRKQMFKDYKIHRPPTPSELSFQLKEAHNLFESFSIKTLELVGYEADDLIGTLSQKFKKEAQILILTGDLDSLQLVEDEKVVVETFKKGISQTTHYDEKTVKERYGLYPFQLIDYKALVGDKSDNIPGVTGVGPKTAFLILQKYKTLDNFLKNGSGEKIFEKINKNKDLLFLSKKLATIDTSVPLEIKLEELKFSPSLEEIKKYFKKNSFNSFLERIKNKKQEEVEKTFKEKNSLQESLFPKNLQEELILIEKEQVLDEKSTQSKKIKVGYDLKEVYKKRFLQPPIFDIKIGLELLEIKTKNWQEANQKIFKEKVEKEKDFLLKTYFWLKEKIEKTDLEKVFYEIEMPLIPVLASMEKNGFLIDQKELKEVKKRIEKEIEKKERKIIEKMGEKINLNSPKQLLHYFQKRGLKIKSTSAENLEKISQNHPFIKDILQYRELFKIKTTYLESLEKFLGKDSRIHPTFLQLGAATGRLSCQNPNLQNIPQESSWSYQIRNIFIAPSNFLLVSFDYSQIELRVLAHLTHDENMIKAFHQDEDIHSLTAQKIFGIKKEEVTQHIRRLAKTLNFGVIYGMGYRALSQTAKISQEEAKNFIKKYFEQFPAIKEWQNDILKLSRSTGVSKNINGRFRSVFFVNSPNQFLSSQAEREAINMPTQSLSADILKLAMSKIFNFINQEKLDKQVKLILSIHDELIFEIEKELLKKEKDSFIVQKIKKIMESVYLLDVPLKTEVKIGKRWGELK